MPAVGCQCKIKLGGVVYESGSNGVITLPETNNVSPVPPRLTVVGQTLTWVGEGGTTSVLLPLAPNPDFSGVAGKAIELIPGGTQGHSPTIGIKLSPSTTNSISIAPDGGLFVPQPSPNPDFSGVAGSAIELIPGGVQGHSPTIGIKLSPSTTNSISVAPDGGLFVPQPSPSPEFSGVAGSAIELVPGGVQGHSPTIGIKLSPSTTNSISIAPDGGLFVPQPSPSPEFSGVAGSAIELVPGGVQGHSPTIGIKLSPSTTNSISIAPDGGLFVPQPSPSPEFSGVAGSAIELVPGGVQGHSPTIGIKLSPSTTNSISIAPDGGLFVPQPVPSPTFAGVAGNAIQITPGGELGHTPTIEVKLSPSTENTISIAPDGGLFVPQASPSPDFSGVAGSAIELVPGGVQGHSPTIGIKLSPSTTNSISIAPDGGLFVPVPTPSPEFSGVAGSAIELVPGGVQGHSPTIGIKLSPSTTNSISIAPDGGLFVPQPSPSPEFSGVAGSAIELVPGGVQGHSPTIGIKLSPSTTNSISIAPDGGLFVPQPVPSPTFTGVAGNAIQITPGGTQGHSPTIAVKLSPSTANTISVAPDGGLFVPQASPSPEFSGVAGSAIELIPGGAQGHSPTIGVKLSPNPDNLVSVASDGGLFVDLPSCIPADKICAGTPGSVLVMPSLTGEGSAPFFKKLNQWEGQINSVAGTNPANQTIAIGQTQLTQLTRMYSQGDITDDGAGTVTIPDNGIYIISADFYLRATWGAISSSLFAFIGAIVVFRANPALHPIASFEHRLDEVSYPIDTAEKWLTCQGSITCKLFKGDRVILRAKVNTKTQSAPGYFYASAPTAIPTLTNAFYGRDSSAINLSIYQIPGF